MAVPFIILYVVNSLYQIYVLGALQLRDYCWDMLFTVSVSALSLLPQPASLVLGEGWCILVSFRLWRTLQSTGIGM